jgi:hypothetical protein
MEFKRLLLQENPKVEVVNASFGNILESVAVFYVAENDKNMQIICKTNYSEKCGSGTFRNGIFLNTENSKCNSKVLHFIHY